MLCSGSLENEAASAKPASRQTGSASEPAEAFQTPGKTPIPEASQAEQPTAMDSQANTGASISCQNASSSAAAGPVSKLSKQPATATPALPASPGFKKSAPSPAANTALTPLAMGYGKTPFKAAATSPLTSYAGPAVSSSPLVSLAQNPLHKPVFSVPRSTGQAGTGKATSLSFAQQRNAQTSHGVSNIIPKLGVASLMNSSRDRNGQSGGRFATSPLTKSIPVSQVPAKPANKTAGTFPSLFKQPLSTNSGNVRPAVTAAFGLAPAQSGVQTSLATSSSKATCLAKAPLTSKTIGMARAAPITGAPHDSDINAVGLDSSIRPVPGQCVHATGGQHTSKSPGSSKQAAKPPQQSLHSKGPDAPDAQTPEQLLHLTGPNAANAQTLADTRPGVPAAWGSTDTDTVMQIEVQERQADPKPWTSTSLAAGLMGNTKNLEEVNSPLMLHILYFVALYDAFCELYHLQSYVEEPLHGVGL